MFNCFYTIHGWGLNNLSPDTTVFQKLLPKANSVLLNSFPESVFLSPTLNIDLPWRDLTYLVEMWLTPQTCQAQKGGQTPPEAITIRMVTYKDTMTSVPHSKSQGRALPPCVRYTSASWGLYELLCCPFPGDESLYTKVTSLGRPLFQCWPMRMSPCACSRCAAFGSVATRLWPSHTTLP